MTQYQVIDRRRSTEQILAELGDQISEVKKLYLRKLVAEIVKNSPVDTATYVSEHEIAESRSSSPATVTSHGKPKNQPEGPAKADALAKLNGQIDQIPDDWDSLVMKNLTVHAKFVEYGGAKMPVVYAPYQRARAVSNRLAREAVEEVKRG